MRRGTTPTHTFTTDIDLSGADVLFITYQQNGHNLLEKNIDDVTFVTEEETYAVQVTLTQEDTLLFCATMPVSVQIRARFGNSAVASQIIKTSAEAILKEGEI